MVAEELQEFGLGRSFFGKGLEEGIGPDLKVKFGAVLVTVEAMDHPCFFQNPEGRGYGHLGYLGMA